MAWIGDDAMKTKVTEYLYKNTVDKVGADALLLHELRAAFECRWCQLVITLSLGLDEEMQTSLSPLRCGMDRSHPDIKVYADILEGYIGGLCAQDREAADDWIDTLIRRFYRDLMREIDGYLASWGLNGATMDVTCIHIHIDWNPIDGPILELKPRKSNPNIPPRIKPLLPTCFGMTSSAHPQRLLQHPVFDSAVAQAKRIPQDKFGDSFRRHTIRSLSSSSSSPRVPRTNWNAASLGARMVQLSPFGVLAGAAHTHAADHEGARARVVDSRDSLLKAESKAVEIVDLTQDIIDLTEDSDDEDEIPTNMPANADEDSDGDDEDLSEVELLVTADSY